MSVPIYDSLGPTAAKYVISHSEMTILAVTEEKLPKLQELIQEDTPLRGIVIVDAKKDSPAVISFMKAVPSSVKVLMFEDVTL